MSTSKLPNPLQWQQEQPILEVLSSLSYRAGELHTYLREIALGVSQLVQLDWSVVTLCQEGREQVLASSIDLGEAANQVYSLHGTLTGTVIETGCSLIVEDAVACSTYGKAPEGYRAYLGVPLCTPVGEVLGTICSFQQQPRQFTDEEVRLVEIFAERAATAIDNYQLYQQQQAFNEKLEAEVVKRTIELQAAQAKLLEANQDLERRVAERTAEKLKVIESLAEVGELAAMIVHEIRNPLTTVLMGLNSLKRVVLPDSARERLALALEEADRLRHLLNEILLYAKPQSLQTEALELNRWSTELLETIYTLSSVQERYIQFVPAQVPVTVLADRSKLKQVVINLINNACEAIAAGDKVTWQIEPQQQQVLIRIHNGGEPIPSHTLLNLTKPFYTTKPSGTGLGLPIVKRIVEAHSGELSIESSSEQGTIVTVMMRHLSVAEP